MASLTLTHTLPLPRWQSNWSIFVTPSFAQLQELKPRKTWGLRAVSKKKPAGSGAEDAKEVDEVPVKKTTKTTKRAPKQSKKKTTKETPEETLVSAAVAVADDSKEESSAAVVPSEDSKKTPKKTRKKATPSAVSLEEETSEKKKTTKRKTKTKIQIEDLEDQGSEGELSDSEGSTTFAEKVTTKRKTIKKNQIQNLEDQGSELELSDSEDSTTFAHEIYSDDDDPEIPEGEDISFTYGWPPLVCCFGAAQHAFIPSGRPANRLIDYKMYERMKDALWVPEKFVRAPGSASSNVAVALASIGGRVAFMGKVGDDEYGETMIYYLNMHNVQTRSIIIDRKRRTAVSHMKIARRGGLRLTCAKPCAEDSLSRSEINIDVLKEAKMFYFNSSSLLDQNMRLVTLRAIRIARKLGAMIFFDVNLSLPLWQSSEETKAFLLQAWNLSDIIEVTKQELEFLCGTEPSENFDTKDNDKLKFIHHKPEVIMPLWHENLKVLFVTNGTSKIHYYTEKFNGSVHGMEAAPVTPFTCDMAVSGDGIVAGLMRMITVMPHLITDRGYLERTIKYAIDCGVVDQWKLARERGFPPKEDMDEDMEEEVVPDPNGIRSITEMQFRTLQRAS